MRAYVVRADARRLPLRDESVDCVVTSPPYWGLRDYGANGQIGLEPTLDEFLLVMVNVFREVRRTLTKSGTLWLNLGDSYAANPPGNERLDHSGPHLLGTRGEQAWTRASRARSTRRFGDLKTKDLIGIPWRVAFALQADGWWLRSDIVWNKPNPMPESITDRPSRAHEFVFLLAKSERYFYDADAIREPYNEASLHRYNNPMQGTDRNAGAIAGARQPGGVWHPKTEMLKPNALGRNARSVWTITTQPYSGAHFATFPEELARRCILAGCPVGGTVLDPFAGSGTVGRVAIETGRNAVLCDLAYQDLAIRRTAEVQMPLEAR